MGPVVDGGVADRAPGTTTIGERTAIPRPVPRDSWFAWARVQSISGMDLIEEWNEESP